MCRLYSPFFRINKYKIDLKRKNHTSQRPFEVILIPASLDEHKYHYLFLINDKVFKNIKLKSDEGVNKYRRLRSQNDFGTRNRRSFFITCALDILLRISENQVVQRT